MLHNIFFVQAWQYELNVMEEAFAAKRPDLGAIDEFKRKESIYLERVQELDEITTKKEQQRKRHDDLRYILLCVIYFQAPIPNSVRGCIIGTPRAY